MKTKMIMQKSFLNIEFIKNGGDIWELKNILGHSSINTTSMYLHMAENFKDVYSPLNEVSKHV